MPSTVFKDLVLHGSNGSKQSVPPFLYSTIYLGNKTGDLVYQALCSGFRGIDTAAYSEHYREDLVGEGLRRALGDAKVKREELFQNPLQTLMVLVQIQTKFTPFDMQDPHVMPCNTTLSISEQVQSSIFSSLCNLRHSEAFDVETAYLDSLVLHCPLPTFEKTLEAWNTAEAYVPHIVRHLGASHVSPSWLEQLYAASTKKKPAVVQDSFDPGTHFNIRLRKFCLERSIVYQGFWTLSANAAILHNAEMISMARQISISTEAAMYCFILALGNISILNGTKNKGHMVEDQESLQKVQEWASNHPTLWKDFVGNFKVLIGESKVSRVPWEAHAPQNLQ